MQKSRDWRAEHHGLQEAIRKARQYPVAKKNNEIFIHVVAPRTPPRRKSPPPPPPPEKEPSGIFVHCPPPPPQKQVETAVQLPVQKAEVQLPVQKTEAQLPVQKTEVQPPTYSQRSPSPRTIHLSRSTMIRNSVSRPLHISKEDYYLIAKYERPASFYLHGKQAYPSFCNFP